MDTMNNPYIYTNGNSIWYNKLGEYHREDGPAIERVNGDFEYYINGIKYASLEEALMDQALR